MQQREVYILPNGEQLRYLKMGAGKKLLLAFHGYSNNAVLFAPFEHYIGQEYTMLSFDLPYHGESAWKGSPFTTNDLRLLVQDMLVAYHVEKVSLMGYSLGGRICLIIAQSMPQSIDKMVLLSSDGLSPDSVYSFTTRTRLGRYLMNRLVENPGGYINVLNGLKKYKLIKASLHTFVLNHLQSRQSREFLQNVWNATSTLQPHTGRLKSMLNNYKIPVYIYAGAFDTIIPLRRAKRFVKGLQTAHLTILNCGHRTITADTIPAISKTLLG